MPTNIVNDSNSSKATISEPIRIETRDNQPAVEILQNAWQIYCETNPLAKATTQFVGPEFNPLLGYSKDAVPPRLQKLMQWGATDAEIDIRHIGFEFAWLRASTSSENVTKDDLILAQRLSCPADPKYERAAVDLFERWQSRVSLVFVDQLKDIYTSRTNRGVRQNLYESMPLPQNNFDGPLLVRRNALPYDCSVIGEDNCIRMFLDMAIYEAARHTLGYDYQRSETYDTLIPPETYEHIYRPQIEGNLNAAELVQANWQQSLERIDKLQKLVWTISMDGKNPLEVAYNVIADLMIIHPEWDGFANASFNEVEAAIRENIARAETVTDLRTSSDIPKVQNALAESLHLAEKQVDGES